MAKKLLVADDSLTIQKVIKLALSGDGYEIQTVSDGTECLQQAALFRPDVILIDIGLPGRSAFDLKKAANEDPDLAKVPFVLMSSAFEKVDEAKVALLRFDGRLTKPFDPSNLKTVLLDALKMNSGQAVREFAPPPPPAASRGGDSRSEITGEIHLMDPNLLPSDPLWNDSAMNEPLSIEPHQGEDSDIRHLTESTVRMSSLDELSSWNIAETSKSSLPPIPSLFSNPKSDTTHHRIELPAGPPRPPTPTPPVTPSVFSNEPGTRSLSMQFQTQETQAQTTTSSEGAGTLEALVEKQVREQLEIMVQGAVKTQLEQMARKALPEIAERVVKAEIRKMLEGLSDT